jgi:S1-C subfamily serine protease
VIGINTAIYSPSGAYAGVGFAVPVDAINHVVPQLIRTGRVDRPGFGILVWPDALVERLIEAKDLTQNGVLVRHVGAGSTAEEAGLRPTDTTGDGPGSLGDLIVAIDDERVANTNDLYEFLAKKKVGDEVVLTIIREGKELKIPITLQAIATTQP